MILSWLISLLLALAPGAPADGQGPPADALFNHVGTTLPEGTSSDDCAACHRGVGMKLSDPSRQLCFGCHHGMLTKSEKLFRHTAVINERYPLNECQGCHQLHRAKGAPMLAEPEPQICYSCHPQTREYKSHPVIAYTNDQGQNRDIVGSDGKIVNCASHCHDLHGADYKHLCRLEPGRELCLSCHKEFE